MNVAGGDPLYAVIREKTTIWRVVGWDGETPMMVPTGTWVWDDGTPRLVPVPVRGGCPERPTWEDEVIFSPDYLSMVDVIRPWVAGVPDAG
jgi:hypothetical protein